MTPEQANKRLMDLRLEDSEARKDKNLHVAAGLVSRFLSSDGKELHQCSICGRPWGLIGGYIRYRSLQGDPVCVDCYDNVVRPKERERDAKRQREEKKARRLKLIREREAQCSTVEGQRDKAGIPVNYFNASFRDAPAGYLIEQQLYVNRDRPILYLFGPSRVGKTRVARALQLQCYRDARPCQFYKALQMIEDHKAQAGDFRFNSDRVRTVDQARAFEGFLIIDDFGSGFPTKWEVRVFDLIVDERSESNRATLITSNLSEAELARLSPRIASRVSLYVEMTKRGDEQG